MMDAPRRRLALSGRRVLEFAMWTIDLPTYTSYPSTRELRWCLVEDEIR
jgi:hypothetical protein